MLLQGADETVYEHVRYGDPDLWKILHVLYNKMFVSASVPSVSLMGMIVPHYKDKRRKACGKDNYRGITLFSVIIKVFEVIILRQLENFAKEKGYFATFRLAFLPVQRLPLLLWRSLTRSRKERATFLPVSWTYGKHLTRCGLMDCFINSSQS